MGAIETALNQIKTDGLFGGIKDIISDQGWRNQTNKLYGPDAQPGQYGTFSQYNIPSFFKDPMSIPALGGALGTGAIMAGTAGLGLGLLGNWALRQYGSTLVLKQQAESAQQIARALEAAQMNSSRQTTEMGRNTDGY